MYTERTAAAGSGFMPFAGKRKVISYYRKKPDIIDISAEAVNRYQEYKKAQEQLREQQIRDRVLQKLVYIMTEGLDDSPEPEAETNAEKKISNGAEKLYRVLFG